MGRFLAIGRRFLVLPIRFYQMVISPVLPPACRYRPTCSEYAIQAILRFGVLRGGWLALRRLGRCHPWGGSGYDPVPKVFHWGNSPGQSQGSGDIGK